MKVRLSSALILDQSFTTLRNGLYKSKMSLYCGLQNLHFSKLDYANPSLVTLLHLNFWATMPLGSDGIQSRNCVITLAVWLFDERSLQNIKFKIVLQNPEFYPVFYPG